MTTKKKAWRGHLEREEMSAKPSDVDARLDDALSRIAVETREIQELEQQLTDGQILANELLQKDLVGILAGLQQYLRGLRLKVAALQAENESLQRRLEDAQRHCRRLADTAHAREQKMAARQEALTTEARVLKRQNAGLEAELREGLNQRLTQSGTGSSVDPNQQDRRDPKRVAQQEDSVAHKRVTQLERRSASQLCDEVQCVEKTLRKRRAELREADRRLMHAHARFHSNQDEEADLRRQTRGQHQRLRAVEAELRDREAESQELCTTVHMATRKLAGLVRACQEAGARLDRTLSQVERAKAELRGVEAEHHRLKR